MISAPWRYYAEKYTGRRWSIVVTCLLSILEFLFVVPSVLLIRIIFDRAIPGADFRLLVLSALGIVALNIAGGALALWVRRIALTTTKRVIANLRADLMLKMYSVSRRYFTQTDTSLLHSHIVHDSERVDVMTNSIITDLLPATVCSIAVSFVLVALNWKLYIALFIAVPIFLVPTRALGRRVKRHAQDFHLSFQGFSQGILFLLETIDLVRIQTAQPLETERQRKRIEELREISGNMAWNQSAYLFLQRCFTTTLLALMLTLGGFLVATHEISIGSLMSFYFSLSLLNGYLRDILPSIPQIISGNESLLAVYQLLEIQDLEPYQGSHRIAFQGNIVFEKVSFAYGSEEVLEEIDLAIPMGSRIALTGPNGSGKTTLLHLLCAFYRPGKGRLLADGRPYDDIDVSVLRESIAVVMQDGILFSGTIFENIAYGLPNATIEDVIRAATIATAHEFISQLQSGYQTLVGEDGAMLSGGQRQRIAIARAIFRKPRILLLDEPTNHLDLNSIASVTRNLRQLEETPTLIVVSHDMQVVSGFDSIYEIRNHRLCKITIPAKAMPAPSDGTTGPQEPARLDNC